MLFIGSERLAISPDSLCGLFITPLFSLRAWVIVYFFPGDSRTRPRPFRALAAARTGAVGCRCRSPRGQGRMNSARSAARSGPEPAVPAPHTAPLRELFSSWERVQAPTINQRPPLCHLPTSAPFSCPLPRSHPPPPPLPPEQPGCPWKRRNAPAHSWGARSPSARASVAFTAEIFRAAPSLCSPSSLGRALTINNFIFLPKNSDVTTVSHRIPASRLHNRLCKIIIAR